MNILKTIWTGLDWSVLTDTLFNLLPALLCVTLHELAHGLAALSMGDTTARDAGRLTLNPLRHLDLGGLLMMAVFHFGWAKPVPVNMYRFRKPKEGMALTALAGPASNLLLSALCLLLYGMLVPPLYGSGAGEYALGLLYRTAWLSTALGVFNLLPVPPLDGSKVLFSLLSDRAYAKLMYYERYGQIALMVLLFAGVLSRPLSTVTGAVFERLMGLAQWSFDLAKELYP